MKDTYIQAKLISPRLIRIFVFSSLSFEKIELCLVVDGGDPIKLTPVKTTSLSAVSITDFSLAKDIELGHSYRLDSPQFGQTALDVSEATGFADFDRDYYYGGNDLGVTYEKDGSSFALWAPLASNVLLYCKDEGEQEFQIHSMMRTSNGVYRYKWKGDHARALYKFFIVNSEVGVFATDPYAKGSTQNGEESVIVDFVSLQVDFNRDCLPVMQSQCDAIIYEAHVRDMTVSTYTDVLNKGTFLGMTEKGRKSRGGNPAGFDYIKSLGITHLQLLPIYDYKTVDETNPSTKYNWGYDPAQYFVPEGSYASVLDDPYSRIIDLKNMVAAYHKEGIRIIMDVVYNHVFDFHHSVFEKVVPNYYFRHRHNGRIASTSGCGDDLATERPMVRKMVLDCCSHWIDCYGIDGFRFDLMGIMDCETLNQIADMAKKKDPNFFLHGEGWNMGGEVSCPLGHMGNYKLLPKYAFFNDFYRERGKRFFCEDYSASGEFKFAMASSCVNYICNAKFLDATQTTNYVECHDNGTFFDLLSSRRKDLSLEDKLSLIKAANATILLSFGVPFFHMGQEIGQSKWGEDNTYNKGDYYNKFSYALLDERSEMVAYFKTMVALRKAMSCFRIYDPRVIDVNLHVCDVGNAIRFQFINQNLIAPYKRLEYFVNPSQNKITVTLEKPERILFDQNGKVDGSESSLTLEIPPRSVIVAGE